MLVRLRSVRRLSKEQFRLVLDLVDLERGDWGLGNCIGQVTVVDGPRRHTVQGRGALARRCRFRVGQSSACRGVGR
jgi:hypothetical protein